MHSFKNLKIHPELFNFVQDELLPGLPVNEGEFWSGFEALLEDYSATNTALLKERDVFQEKLDMWFSQNPNASSQTQEAFLREIDYLLPPLEPTSIETKNLDPEVSQVPGPQLVVPADNARYALNASNARWGSLLDALYGTDMIENSGDLSITKSYNPKRGEAVFAKVYDFLDETLPLEKGSYKDIEEFSVTQGSLHVSLKNSTKSALQDPNSFVGYLGETNSLQALLFKHHGLHVEILIDPSHPIGKTNPAGISDVKIEAALSAIQDFEDSVAAVDALDKTHLYRNWLGLMKGTLEATFEANGKTKTRVLEKDREYTSPKEGLYSVKTRALLLVRNVGIHMKSEAILYNDEPIYEGMLDAYICAACGIHDRQRSSQNNSATGSIYIVKPKCHGPKEIAFVNTLFTEIESTLKLPAFTIKMGIMDEERRTSANLARCIYEARKRVFFINTGFLDRTGDEIHSCMKLGPVAGKEGLKKATWLSAYEAQNVDVGLLLGFYQKAQIGKGMWTMTERMQRMSQDKIGHVKSGASTAWVPSPTAATLHALHYHTVNVLTIQSEALTKANTSHLEALLTPPLLQETLDAAIIQHELENAIQSILGYVVRWVDQGVGCSKVPDRNDENLMEDRATLRIGAQLLANWLHHNLVNKDQVEKAFEAMAQVVDKQNADDASYLSLLRSDSSAMRAAKELVYEGENQPNGYTEFILHKWRLHVKKSH